MSNNLVVPENITILPLPPKLSELNPVENIWPFMRDNWLSNRVFKSHEVAAILREHSRSDHGRSCRSADTNGHNGSDQ